MTGHFTSYQTRTLHELATAALSDLDPVGERGESSATRVVNGQGTDCRHLRRGGDDRDRRGAKLHDLRAAPAR